MSAVAKCCDAKCTMMQELQIGCQLTGMRKLINALVRLKLNGSDFLTSDRYAEPVNDSCGSSPCVCCSERRRIVRTTNAI